MRDLQRRAHGLALFRTAVLGVVRVLGVDPRVGDVDALVPVAAPDGAVAVRRVRHQCVPVRHRRDGVVPRDEEVPVLGAGGPVRGGDVGRQLERVVVDFHAQRVLEALPDELHVAVVRDPRRDRRVELGEDLGAVVGLPQLACALRVVDLVALDLFLAEGVLGERRRAHGGAAPALAAEHHVDVAVPVHRHRKGLRELRIGRPLGRRQLDHAGAVVDRRARHDVDVRLAFPLLGRDLVDPAVVVGVTGEEAGLRRRAVRDDDRLHLVDVGVVPHVARAGEILLGMLVVVRVPLQRDPRLRDIVEHVRPGTGVDAGNLAEVARLLRRQALRRNHHEGGRRERAQVRGERLVLVDAKRQVVRRIEGRALVLVHEREEELVHIRAAVRARIRVALQADVPVLRGHLAAVRGLGVEAHALTQVEHQRLGVHLLPALRRVGVELVLNDRERHQLAVGLRHPVGEGDRDRRVEARRVRALRPVELPAVLRAVFRLRLGAGVGSLVVAAGVSAGIGCLRRGGLGRRIGRGPSPGVPTGVVIVVVVAAARENRRGTGCERCPARQHAPSGNAPPPVLAPIAFFQVVPPQDLFWCGTRRWPTPCAGYMPPAQIRAFYPRSQWRQPSIAGLRTQQDAALKGGVLAGSCPARGRED